MKLGGSFRINGCRYLMDAATLAVLLRAVGRCGAGRTGALRESWRDPHRERLELDREFQSAEAFVANRRR